MITNLQNSYADLKTSFHFLEARYACKIIEENADNMGVNILYQNSHIKFSVSFDYRDNCLYFYLVRGANTQFPNDNDPENIKDIYCLVQKYSIPDIMEADLQPDKNGYLEALQLNAALLEKYGDDILKGREWF